MPSRHALITALAALLACTSGQDDSSLREALAQSPYGTGVPASVAFRFPATPGQRNATLYRLPDLDQVAWRFEAEDNPVARTVGFAGDDDLAFTLTSEAELVALDLASGRARVVDSSVALATIGPAGRPYVVHHDSSVATIRQRSVNRWPVRFDGLPSAIWGAARNRLIGLVPDEQGRTLQLLSDGQAPVSQRLPGGVVALSRWGDLAAVATDSGLVVLDPTASAPARFAPLADAARVVEFSPSAHRIFVADAAGRLLSTERFSLTVLDTLLLEGPASALRTDPGGRLLLVQSQFEAVIWVVDQVHWELVGSVEGQWDEQLPIVAPDGTVLLRRGIRIVALSPDSLRQTGVVLDEQGDQWLPLAWDPRRPVLEFAESGQTEEPESGQLIYVQVSATHNDDWARDLAANLGRAGMPASVLPPADFLEPFRVVLGPYPTREEAEETRRMLDMPSWILTLDTARTTP
ncbi:MAG: SPOR domain-containing protein [Gemmatimonadota bacterium]|nr:MAG: SPOR domain-containing protein [Gemmatimonadota bacterium]